MSLLAQLSDRHYTSGQQIAEKLAISRASVSSRVQQLMSMGIAINIIKGKGYRLVESLDLLAADIIKTQLLSQKSLVFFSVINVSAQTESTNIDAKLANYPDARWQLHCTEYQTQGRGRRGRQWHSGLSASVMLSLSRKSHYPISLLYSISLVAGVGVARVLQAYGVNVTLKWPNDIYVNGKKLAGILCEIHGNPLDDAVLVIGIGLNVSASPVNTDIPACSLAELGVFVSRSELIAKISGSVVDVISEIEKKGSVCVLAEWSRLDLLYGRRVLVIKGESSFEGVAKGIDDKGELIIELTSGEYVTLNGGEVSIRW